jgi:hypothetical protein
MSYSQILKRAGRIFEARLRDLLGSQDDDELRAFDDELKRAQQAPRDEKSTGPDTRQKRENTGQQHTWRTGGKRKPGEADTAVYMRALGLPPDASNDDIRKAYKKLMWKYHPDRVAGKDPKIQEEAAERAKQINEAYQILRRRFDFR